LAGGIPIAVPTRAEECFALKAEAVRSRITPRTRVLLFASPAAPTGGVTTGADLAALADLARAYNLQVIWDETYRDFVFDGVAQDPIAALPGMWERTVVVGSFSTRYAMAGWRAGYVVGPAALLRPVALMKQSLTICSPAPSQWAALAALEGPQDEVALAVREVAARRAAALRALAALGLSCGGGTGTPYLFVDVRDVGADGRAFADAALREAGVRLVPGELFGAAGAGFVRLTLAAPVPVLEEAIGRLAPVVTRLRGELGQKGGH
jgi:aminotransferase